MDLLPRHWKNILFHAIGSDGAEPSKHVPLKHKGSKRYALRAFVF